MRRRILTFSLFEAGQAAAAPGLTKKQEEFLNRYTKGSWKYDPTTGLVDVDGDFECQERRLSTLSGVKFGRVSGSFNCQSNRLTSLEGAPQEVGEGFDCHHNKLTSLKGAPQKVGGDFDCFGNTLTSLEGAPQKVGGDFYCMFNKLTSLQGAPQEVGGIFHCSENNLTFLEGAPQKVGGGFYCDAFKLDPREWNPEGWVEVLHTGTVAAKKLICTLLTPDQLNQEIQKDPAGMIMNLKGVWNSPDFAATRAKLVWPQGYGEEMDIVGGLNTIGF